MVTRILGGGARQWIVMGAPGFGGIILHLRLDVLDVAR